jgi:hypothetical protein
VIQRTESSLQANKGDVEVKSAKISSFTPSFPSSFPICAVIQFTRKLVKSNYTEKCASATDLRRAGAIPLFVPSSTQKIFGAASARFQSKLQRSETASIELAFVAQAPMHR